MNGPQHYAKAEELLASINYNGTHAGVQAVAALAQVHATLALAAATVDAAELHSVETNGHDVMTEWGEVTR